jgi:dinuclear metal center YbgI/SA1388 family protein
MTKLADVVAFLERFAPPELAADWDNVGLLTGDRAQSVERIVTCLTVTDAVVAEAIAERADLIVSHHPLPFRGQKTITTDTHDGRRLWRLAAAGIAIYSPHTAFDSAAEGINFQLAKGLGLTDIRPLVRLAPQIDPALGIGRYGSIAPSTTMADVVARVKSFLKISAVQVVGDDVRRVRSVGVACGSAADHLADAIRTECDLFVTGEASFHKAIEAEASDIAMVLVGHYASERFGVERLAEALQREFATLTVWAARQEADPLRFA